MKGAWLSIGLLCSAFFVLNVGTASAICNDGTAAGETLNCDSNPPGGAFEGQGGNDTMTVSANVTGEVWGDGNGANGNLAGNGGNDTITINSGVTLTGNVFGDAATGAGGNDTIIVNGTVTGVVTGDISGTPGGNDTIIINGRANSSVYGTDGNDTIIINGAVGGFIAGDSGFAGTGDDTIIINIAAPLGSLIFGDGGTNTLQFTGTGASQTEINTANTLAGTCSPATPCTGILTLVRILIRF
jgi:hypothetical protein